MRPATMLRRLIADFEEFPATMTLAAAWVAVFGLMLLARLQTSPLPAFGQILFGNGLPAHRFGDLTLRELYRGEAWRALTCTFVHYNLLHIGMNLYGLYQLGCLVETWYGPKQFVAVYAVIGGGGNLLSGAVRRALGSNPVVHSGGGSTVVLGLVALCAVVGWRSRTRMGDYLRAEMVGILLFTAVLGQLLPIIDNWGHAGGALVGAGVGLAHRILIRTVQRPIALWAGILGAVLLIASGAAQVRDNHDEDILRTRLRAAERLDTSLLAIEQFYLIAHQRAGFERMTFVPKAYLKMIRRPAGGRRTIISPIVDTPEADFRDALKAHLATLDDAKGELGTPPTSADFRRVRELLAGVLDRRPTPSSAREFLVHWQALKQRAGRERTALRDRIEGAGPGGRRG